MANTTEDEIGDAPCASEWTVRAMKSHFDSRRPIHSKVSERWETKRGNNHNGIIWCEREKKKRDGEREKERAREWVRDEERGREIARKREESPKPVTDLPLTHRFVFSLHPRYCDLVVAILRNLFIVRYTRGIICSARLAPFIDKETSSRRREWVAEVYERFERVSLGIARNLKYKIFLQV